MKKNVRAVLLTTTEIGMIFYWLMAVGLVLNVIQIPAEYMYSDYKNPIMVVWNWSFFPLDILFCILGLWGRFGKHPSEKKEKQSQLYLYRSCFRRGLWLYHSGSSIKTLILYGGG